MKPADAAPAPTAIEEAPVANPGVAFAGLFAVTFCGLLAIGPCT